MSRQACPSAQAPRELFAWPNTSRKSGCVESLRRGTPEEEAFSAQPPRPTSAWCETELKIECNNFCLHTRHLNKLHWFGSYFFGSHMYGSHLFANRTRSFMFVRTGVSNTTARDEDNEEVLNHSVSPTCESPVEKIQPEHCAANIQQPVENQQMFHFSVTSTSYCEIQYTIRES